MLPYGIFRVPCTRSTKYDKSLKCGSLRVEKPRLGLFLTVDVVLAWTERCKRGGVLNANHFRNRYGGQIVYADVKQWKANL